MRNQLRPGGVTSSVDRKEPSPTAGSSAAPPPQPVPVDMDAGKRRARRIDKLSRKCFPLSFVAFNIVYWVVYTRSSHDLDDLSAAI